MNDNFGLPESPEQIIARLTAENAALAARLAAAPDDDAPANEGVGPADAQGFPRRYVRLEIYRGNNPQELSYVPVGINGYVFKITRGVEVVVPDVVVQTLEHALEDITTQSEGGLVTRPSLRFPFTVRGEASESEYLAFQAKMREAGKNAAMQRA